MLNLARWLKENGFRADQVQTFYPSPMATATAMYYSEKKPVEERLLDLLSMSVWWQRQDNGGCTKPFCVTMIRITGLCCVKLSAKWVAVI